VRLTEWCWYVYLCDICYCSEINFIFTFSRKIVLFGGKGPFKQNSCLVQKITEHLEFLIFYFLSFKNELFLFSDP